MILVLGTLFGVWCVAFFGRLTWLGYARRTQMQGVEFVVFMACLIHIMGIVVGCILQTLLQ